AKLGGDFRSEASDARVNRRRQVQPGIAVSPTEIRIFDEGWMPFEGDRAPAEEGSLPEDGVSGELDVVRVEAPGVVIARPIRVEERARLTVGVVRDGRREVRRRLRTELAEPEERR